MNVATESVALNLLGAIVYSTLVLFAGRFWAVMIRKTKAKRLWPFDSDSIVIMAKSVETDTGKYTRPATGLGQVRALAMISPTLSEVSGEIDVNRVVFSDFHLHHLFENNLVLLGGVKNNEMTRMILSKLSDDKNLVSQKDSLITWDGVTYEGKVNAEGEIETDYGYFIRCKNPFGTKGTVVVILAGAHTYGTLAAARWYVEESQKRGSAVRNHRYFEGLVEVNVIKGHVTIPKLLNVQVLND